MGSPEAQVELFDFLDPDFRNRLTDAQRDRILSLFVREEFGKRTQIFINGDSNTRHYFVIRGLLRLYIIDPSGKEFNVLFAREGQVLGDLASPRPTPFNLDTIEDSVVHSISSENLEVLRREFSDQAALDSNTKLKRSYIFLQKRLVSILSKTAEENYLELRRTQPQLLDRLPQYHIASYLGVSPEFLSKIVKQLLKKGPDGES
ncbi:MAG: Crp/Fnr family transcriptional regulator [Bacteroidales bacterium]